MENITTDSKSKNRAVVDNEGQQVNIELITVINLTQQIMDKLVKLWTILCQTMDIAWKDYWTSI